MDARVQRVAELLHEVSEVHHVVYRVTDGTDDDWASFYADWLTRHSELGEVLGDTPVRSHLAHELVECDRAYTRAAPDQRWEDWYAGRVAERFSG